RFLGHGVGLQIDEYPVIANRFDEPFIENMVIAVEPKCGIPGFGTVGVEDTYIVTQNGGKCITGGEKDIMII
ncbi:MAG: M24 family metallopeptidase, partial [Lachnoclostridium sp.]|nr:M24 family metallopeptidase [Lachnoclostridium sp.]